MHFSQGLNYLKDFCQGSLSPVVVVLAVIMPFLNRKAPMSTIKFVENIKFALTASLKIENSLSAPAEE